MVRVKGGVLAKNRRMLFCQGVIFFGTFSPFLLL